MADKRKFICRKRFYTARRIYEPGEAVELSETAAAAFKDVVEDVELVTARKAAAQKAAQDKQQAAKNQQKVQAPGK